MMIQRGYSIQNEAYGKAYYYKLLILGGEKYMPKISHIYVLLSPKKILFFD